VNRTKCGGRNPGLGREEDLRLLAAAHRRRRRRYQGGQPGIEPSRGHPVSQPSRARSSAGRAGPCASQWRPRCSPAAPSARYAVAGRSPCSGSAGGPRRRDPTCCRRSRAPGPPRSPSTRSAGPAPRGARWHRPAPTRDLRALQRPLRAEGREVVGALRLAYPPPDPCRVNEPPDAAAKLDELVHRIPGGARGPRRPGRAPGPPACSGGWTCPRSGGR